MPSDRRQINVRVDETTEALLPRLQQAIGEQHGLTVTLANLFRMGMMELKRKYLPEQPVVSPLPPHHPPKPRRPRKS